MKKIKIWLNWFSAKDARTLVEKHSVLKHALKTIAKRAKEGGRESLAYGLTPEDVDKLVELGYSVELYSNDRVDCTILKKHLIKW